MNSTSTDFIAYHYTPSLPAAAIFTAIFGISTLIHVYQCVRTHSFYMTPLIVGGVLETVGYICRIKSSTEAPDFKLTAYIIQTITILIAPAFTAATIYIVFGRIILVVDGESRSLIRQRNLTLIFVCGDIFSLVVQSNGASILTKKKPNSATVGKWIVTGGLAIQVLFFGLFMLISIIFYRRLRRSPTQKAQLIPHHWQIHIFHLYAASTLIMVRSVFRVVEYTQGKDGYLLSHEIFLYMFDALLMGAVTLLFNIVHPSIITALLNGTKATRMLRVYTLKKLSDDVPETPLQHLRHQTGSPNHIDSAA